MAELLTYPSADVIARLLGVNNIDESACVLSMLRIVFPLPNHIIF